MRSTYGQALRLQAQRDPERPAVTAGDTVYTRAELDAHVDRLAAGLRALGCTRGNVVSFTGANHAGLIALSFAIWRVGAVPFPIPWHRAAEAMSALLELSEPQVAVDFPDVVGWTGCRTTLAELAELATPDPEAEDVQPPRLRIGTSGGSTGKPKAIVIDALADIEPDVATFCGMTVAGTHVLPLNITDGAGFTTAMAAVATGSHLVIMEQFDPRECVRSVERHRADWMATTPPVLLAIEKLGSEIGDRLSGLTVTHFSGYVGDWLKRSWIERLGAERVWGTYGGTDARGSVWGNGRVWLERPGVAGLPDPSACAVSIRDANGEPVPAETIGRIYIRDWTSKRNFHYLGAPTQPNIEGYEWIGDLGYLDEDGYLYVVDRESDVINTSDGTVYPNRVEAELERHPLVRSAIVVPGRGGVHAIVDSPETRPMPAELADFVQLDAHEVPQDFTFVDEQLRDLAGKAHRGLWRQRVPGGGNCRGVGTGARVGQAQQTPVK
jgi:bile acid-coenzyme A ligase